MFVCRRCARAIQPYYAAVQQGGRTLHLRERTERPPAFLQLQQKPPNLHRLSQTDCRQTAVSSDAHRHQTAELQAFKHPDVHHAENQVSLGLDVIPRLSALQEVSEAEAIRIPVSSALPCVSSTLQPYVEESETLRKLVQLGVNLWKLEQRPNVGSMLVRLDFKEDVAPRLLFLKDLGVEECNLGALLTKNPFILTESLDRLEARADYLKSKKFSAQSVAAMVTKAPYLLNFSVERMDNRLGFFYQELGLSAEKTRKLVIRLPKLLCGSLEPVKENLKVFELEFGFRGNEVQHIVTTVPKVLMANKRKLTQIFDFVHNTMDVPLFVIAKFPQVLNGRFLRIRERHMFLDFLGRAQYDPSQAAYIPLDRLVSLPDDAFCSEFALASVEDFERFQKTL